MPEETINQDESATESPVHGSDSTLHQHPTPIPHIHGPGCSHDHQSAPFVRATQKVGRNDLCPCGSQQKYKKCHGQRQ